MAVAIAVRDYIIIIDGFDNLQRFIELFETTCNKNEGVRSKRAFSC